MSENILKKIIDNKTLKINHLKNKISIDSLINKIKENITFADFKRKIINNYDQNKNSIIAEIKKASPSAGIIIKNYDPVNIAKIYKSNNATCLSVLTEEDFFFGNLIHISKIKEKVNLPILCKDFFVDIFQVHLAKSYGADAILIILAGISEELADNLYEEALKLNMTVIVEVHTVEEAKKSLKYSDALIGINNRDLKTFEISLTTTKRLSRLATKDIVLVSESGIKTKRDIEKIKSYGVNVFLIGETFMRAPDPGRELQELFFT